MLISSTKFVAKTSTLVRLRIATNWAPLVSPFLNPRFHQAVLGRKSVLTEADSIRVKLHWADGARQEVRQRNGMGIAFGQFLK